MPESNEWGPWRESGTGHVVRSRRGDAAGRSNIRTQVMTADYANELEMWKRVITDIAVVDWVLTTENAEDAYKCIKDIVAMAVQIQLDPAVSEQAAKLADAEAKVRRAEGLAKALEKLLPKCKVCNGRPTRTLVDLQGHRELRCQEHIDTPIPHGRKSLVPYHKDDEAWELLDAYRSGEKENLLYVADGGADPAFEGDPGIAPTLYRRSEKGEGA